MKKFGILILLGLAITACNKDDVITPDEPETGGYRPATDLSSPYQTHVFEYTPAPGQFINETVLGGFTADVNTPEAACAYALQRMQDSKFVSLGSFGGYIVVGFDHSIKNSKGNYDLAILGNPMDSSNEPGVVWVMQDSNGNGLPDDEWYELRGSETGKSGTIQNYSVTYYRPEAPGKPVEWSDSEGNSGTVDYLKAYHKQDYYYPAWISTDTYTLTGTRLEAQNYQDSATGNWINPPYDWGYVDNIGSDAFANDPQWCGFKLSNAMKVDGTPANLDYIDFVKVQGAVLAKSGWIGENSCEVFSIADYTLLNK